jgi:hypothetical protein
MPQIITQLIHPNAINVNNLEQVAQISINNNNNTNIATIEVTYNINNEQVVLMNNNNVYFYVTSPDTDNITIYDILTFLNYSSAHINLDYCEYGNIPISDIIHIPVIDAPLSQMTVYPHNNITLNTPEHTQTNNDGMIIEQETPVHEHLVIDESFIDNPIDVTHIANLTPIIQIDSPVSFNYIDSFDI